MSGEATLRPENSERKIGRSGLRLEPHWGAHSTPWSETSVLEQDRSETKKKSVWSGLAGFVLCCEIQSCHARRHNDLGGYSSISSTSLVSLFCAWNITTVEINSDVHLLKS